MIQKIKIKVIKLCLFLSAILLLSSTVKIKETLKVGEIMPAQELALTRTDKSETNLSNFKENNGTLVIFTCNTCPFVVGSESFEGWEKEYNGLTKLANVSEIGIVLINSNAAKRENGDSLEDMAKRAKEKGYRADYVLDKKSKVADAFGAKTTPHVFLFDDKDKLVYEGQIDNAYNPKVKEVTPFLKEAMIHIANQREVEISKTDAIGCSIKRIK